MPIYDYTCSHCGHLVEVIHGIHETGPRFCPSCGAESTMRKGFAAPAVHFKGSGWAKKDRSTTSSAGKSTKAGDDAAVSGAAMDTGSGATAAGGDATTPSSSGGTAATATTSGGGD